MDVVIQWIDLIWLPVGLFAVHKGHRIFAAFYFIACSFMLRMQVELMASIGYPRGILPLLDSGLFIRGLIVYTLFHVFYLVTAHYSPNSDKHVFLAASISIFFAALFTSMIVMLL